MGSLVYIQLHSGAKLKACCLVTSLNERFLGGGSFAEFYD
jgi:hypothetical protein